MHTAKRIDPRLEQFDPSNFVSEVDLRVWQVSICWMRYQGDRYGPYPEILPNQDGFDTGWRSGIPSKAVWRRESCAWLRI